MSFQERIMLMDQLTITRTAGLSDQTPDEIEKEVPWNDIGRNIKAARLAYEWTEEDLADAANVSQDKIIEYELAPLAHPTLLTDIPNLAKAMGVEEDILLLSHKERSDKTQPTQELHDVLQKAYDLEYKKLFCSDTSRLEDLVEVISTFLKNNDVPADDDVINVTGLMALIIHTQTEFPIAIRYLREEVEETERQIREDEAE